MSYENKDMSKDKSQLFPPICGVVRTKAVRVVYFQLRGRKCGFYPSNIKLIVTAIVFVLHEDVKPRLHDPFLDESSTMKHLI
jgi:hypothetical protein